MKLYDWIKEKIKSYCCNRLWVQVAAVLLVVMTIMVIVSGVLLVWVAEDAVQGSVLVNHKEIAVRAAEEIDLFVSRAEDMLVTTAAMLGSVYPSSWKQETIMVELALDQPVFIRIAAVDLSGKLIASSELDQGLVRQYPDEALNAARQQKTYFSRIQLLDNSMPYITIAVPVKRLGEIAQVLIADVDMRGIWDIVDSIQIGKTGKAFLVSERGVLIAHSDKKRVLKEEDLARQKDVQSVLSGQRSSLETEDSAGKQWVSSFAPVRSLGWGLVLRQARPEAYKFAQSMKIHFLIILLVSEILAIAVSIMVALNVTRPVKVLVHSITRVAAGDLDNKVATSRRDEIGELIRAFNNMIDKLKKAKEQEMLSAVGLAAARISHELRNSLVLIKSFIQLFPRRHTDVRFVGKFSRLLPEEILRWERMLKELSDFSSQQQLNVCDINISNFLRSTADIMEESLRKQNIDLRCAAGTDNLFIKGDPERLRQVLVNLMINAVHAMPEGGTLVFSAATVFPEQGSGPAEVEIRVRDTGAGIASEDMKRIFEPFYTKRTEGMGLGLSISKKIIEQHQGRIFVESKPKAGTTFVLRFPGRA